MKHFPLYGLDYVNSSFVVVLHGIRNVIIGVVDSSSHSNKLLGLQYTAKYDYTETPLLIAVNAATR